MCASLYWTGAQRGSASGLWAGTGAKGAGAETVSAALGMEPTSDTCRLAFTSARQVRGTGRLGNPIRLPFPHGTGPGVGISLPALLVNSRGGGQDLRLVQLAAGLDLRAGRSEIYSPLPSVPQEADLTLSGGSSSPSPPPRTGTRLLSLTPAPFNPLLLIYIPAASAKLWAPWRRVLRRARKREAPPQEAE